MKLFLKNKGKTGVDLEMIEKDNSESESQEKSKVEDDKDRELKIGGDVVEVDEELVKKTE